MTKGNQALALKEAGRTNQEIADELGMSAKSVRRLVSEAKGRRAYLESLRGITRDGDIVSRPILPPEWGQVNPPPPHFPGRLDHITPTILPADWAPPGHKRRAFPRNDHDHTNAPDGPAHDQSISPDSDGMSAEEIGRLFNSNMYRECNGGCGTRRWQSALFICEDCTLREHTPLATTIYSQSPRRHFFIPDPQARPDESLDHMRWIGEYAAEQEPDVIVNAGDHWDMASLSSYEKPGSKYFEGRRVLADIEAGNRALELFEQGFAKRARAGWGPRRVMLRGNHEDRITRMLNDNPTLEGAIGFDKFNDVPLGWEVFDYRVPVEIDGLTYSHLFYNPGNGRPYSGNVETMIKNIGFSFVQGHQQGLRWGRRELGNGKAQTGLIAGSSYLHEEEYRGPQAKVEWRGVCVLHEVADGSYDPMFVSMNYLKRKFGC